jgi:hypothetical protein
MYSPEDLKSLHGFLRQTAEGNLKKMLIGGTMTEAHLRILLKVARSVSETEFITYWTGGTFPKLKFSQQEITIKDNFYTVCGEACAKVGLISNKTAA